MRTTLFLLLIGLAFGPVLCGPSPVLAAHADQASVIHAVDTHDACDGEAQPAATAGPPPVLAATRVAAVDLRLVPPAALPRLANAFTPHGAVQLRTPLRL